MNYRNIGLYETDLSDVKLEHCVGVEVIKNELVTPRNLLFAL